MPKWLSTLIIVLLVVVVVFLVVSLVLASLHNVNLVGEWQRWIDAMKPAKDAVETTAKVFFK